MTTKYNFTLNQGETFDTTIVVLTADRRPFDLTTYTARSQVRDAYESTDPLVSFTIAVISPTEGKLRLSLTATQTAALNFNKAVYDIELQNINTGVVYRVIQGVITLSKEVTR